MKVEIWSDVVCPWCYIGKRRFEAALAAFPHRDDVEITYRSFQLDPLAPAEPSMSVTETLAQKYGVSETQARAMNARVSALAAQEGLDYHLEGARHANTFDAHRLIHFAAAHGRQHEMKERLLRAYFTESATIGDRDTLARLATEVGLDERAAQEALSTDAYAQEVRADERRAQMLGITGVPFFVIEEKYGVSGAQPTEAFEEILNEVWTENHPLARPRGAQNAEACDGDVCAVTEE